MKKVILSILTIFIVSCEQPNYIKGDSERLNGLSSIEYFKDIRTNQCFAILFIDGKPMIMCVPCDSLVNLHIYDK